MRINFFYKDTKEPVVLQDDFYVDMYGKVVEFRFPHVLSRDEVDWEILNESKK